MHKCIVCDSDDFNKIYSHTLLKCNSCGFICANMSLNDEQLKEIYSANYFKGNEYRDYIADKSVLQKNFSKRINRIRINNITEKKINALEIGCAYGFFGEVFMNNFKNAEYTGIDIATEAIDYGKEVLGLNLKFQDYLSFSAVEKYSHVFMWDVIEHLPRPDLFIEKISGEIILGGELHITTGDIGAILPKIQKQNWRMIHPPSHLQYFAKKTLSMLLIKNGFEIKEISYQPVYRSAKQIFYSLFLLNKSNKKNIEGIYNKIPEKWFIPLNTFDIMHIIAVKE